jgi:formylglycine-generating enzyme
VKEDRRIPYRLEIPFDREAALVAQAEWAKACDVPLRNINSLGMQFILVPPGGFICGGTDETDNQLARQGFSKIGEPRFHCILTKPMYVGIHRVTQEEYRTLMGVNLSYYAETGDLASHVEGLDTSQFPVEGISWYDCIEACNNLSEKEGLTTYYQFGKHVVRNVNGAIIEADVAIVGGTGYRLLTSAEWEWVARAGTTTVYFHGNEKTCPEWKHDIGRPWPVGAEPSNNFGVFDLHMFAEEWTFDAYSYGDRIEGPQVDPVHLINVDNERVARGFDCFSRIMEVSGAAEYRNFRFCRTIEVDT